MARYLTCLQRLGVSTVNFTCRTCARRYREWQDRCAACGTWNSVDLDIRDEQVTAEDLGVVKLPVWGGYGPLEETSAPADEKTPAEG